ncbi:haloacid dehalogenase type II [Arthrobacter sp. KK5.5]|uniref:haloacid dehalogenase type II n=1 Tax=Arthrobacter sp. KK5.5 TaxID=3373084 RepID=UPI003EE81DF8
MSTVPAVIVFDVNETLSDMSSLGDRFAEVGAPAELAKVWFASLLRDGFALTSTGDNTTFAQIGADSLRGLLVARGADTDLDGAVDHIMGSIAGLPLHPDVPDGIRSLASAGHRLVTLTNGSVATTEKLLTAGGVREEFEALLSVEDAPVWKPAPASYGYAAARTGAEPADLMLVAVHAWDIHGAARAGLRTAWINRSGADYPTYFEAPDVTVAALTELAEALGR